MIDAEQLIEKLGHYKKHAKDILPADFLATIGDAEQAITSLREWVTSLQLSKAEVDALEYVVVEGRIACPEDYGILRSLLVRLRPEWETK